MTGCDRHATGPRCRTRAGTAAAPAVGVEVLAVGHVEQLGPVLVAVGDAPGGAGRSPRATPSCRPRPPSFTPPARRRAGSGGWPRPGRRRPRAAGRGTARWAPVSPDGSRPRYPAADLQHWHHAAHRKPERFNRHLRPALGEAPADLGPRERSAGKHLDRRRSSPSSIPATSRPNGDPSCRLRITESITGRRARQSRAVTMWIVPRISHARTTSPARPAPRAPSGRTLRAGSTARSTGRADSAPASPRGARARRLAHPPPLEQELPPEQCPVQLPLLVSVSPAIARAS